MNESPYLREQRLQDVIAALQFLGSYDDYDLTLGKFREKIAAEPRSATNWGEIFAEHPEFFRQSEHGKDYSLVLRRSKEKLDNGLRPPLTENEMSMLINISIHLQKHALEMHREKRALYPIILTAVGILATLAGTLVGAALKSNSWSQ
jgi:hypothetical protein